MMAYSNNIDGPWSNLSHVSFISNDDVKSKELQSQPIHKSTPSLSNGSTQDRSHISSPSSLRTDTTTETTTTTSSSEMNPLAAAFTPRFMDSNSSSIPPAPAATQLFELRKTVNKGFGLFATSHIPRGTLIICEQPLMRVSSESVHFAWGTYCRLNSAEKAAFDSLHGHQAEGLDFENASRTLLIDPNDDSMDEDDIEELVAEQIRVMKIFSVNNFHLPPSDLGIYAIASRLNHSCVPNAHHSYNPVLKKITVYTVKDILPDEELCTTYLGGEGHYYMRPQRLELLRSRYGFTCDCPACVDRTGTSDGRREAMASITWGLAQFRDGVKSVNQFIPTDRIAALKQAEDLITVMLNEGLVTIELAKAYRTASRHALQLQNYEKSVEYARDEAEVEKNCMGTVLDDLKQKGVATECWLREIFATIKAEKGEQAVRDLGGVINDHRYARKKQKAMKKKVSQPNAALANGF
jgi:hypothetical protein